MQVAAIAREGSVTRSQPWALPSLHGLTSNWLDHALTTGVLTLVASVVWFSVPVSPDATIPQSPVAVLRPQMVRCVESDAAFRTGDSIYFVTPAGPGSGRVEGLPGQGLTLRDGHGREHFTVLGAHRYWVLQASGAGTVVDRAAVRGRVFVRPD